MSPRNLTPVLGILLLVSTAAFGSEEEAANLATLEEVPRKVASSLSVRNDVSRPLSTLAAAPARLAAPSRPERPLPAARTSDAAALEVPDPVVQNVPSPFAMPATTLNFDGIPFPGVACNCAPPSSNGAAGATQYVQMVNMGLQVFNKTTGASVLGPIGITALWSGFGGACESSGRGDPVVLHDQLANRWVVSQFAQGSSSINHECVAVSTTNDATGTWFRYDFLLGPDFYDYPKLAIWPDAYYLSTDAYNSSSFAYLGPQPFALNRAAMLVGSPATMVSFGPLSTSLGFMLPGDLDGSVLPPAGAPNPWLSTELPNWQLYRFHVDWVNPANSTFTLGGALTPASYLPVCPATRSCVPQPLTTDGLDAIGSKPMFRLAYRRFRDGHEALVGNRTISFLGVAGIRWWEIDHATSGVPGFVQQGTHSPDTTWRWMGSAAMDASGNLAIGFSASSSVVFPQIRYAGRLAADPVNILGQGEATLFAGTGSQTGTVNRWGDYSSLALDPVDDCTFWYTNEYYATTSQFNWRTRIGSFKFPGCHAGLLFYTLPPCRVLDTRLPAGTYGAPSLIAGGTRSWPLASVCGLPPDARAVSANVTITGPTQPGYLTLFPGDGTQPLASSINFTAGQTRANNVILPVSSDGTAAVKAYTGSAGPVEFILDVNGFFR